MPHPTIDNRTAFAAEVLHLTDEEYRPLAMLAVKASFDILRGGLARSEWQAGLDHVGVLVDPRHPDVSSLRYEPEVAPFKLATDVVLLGHAHAPRRGTTTMDVELRVGPLAKRARVIGDRRWYGVAGMASLTAPLAFETMPLVYERAFGGWDRSAPNPEAHRCEPRNPSGRGFCARSALPGDGLPAPNLEDVDHLIRSLRDRPPPVGFGFIAPHWQPRAALAGTYDAVWQRARCPLLPSDFDRRHFNAASPGLIADGYLRGDEEVRATGFTSAGPMQFRLPGVPPPTVCVGRAGHEDASLPLAFDTLVIDLDAHTLYMIWRASIPLRGGPHDLRFVVFESIASHALPRAGRDNSAARAANQAS